MCRRNTRSFVHAIVLLGLILLIAPQTRAGVESVNFGYDSTLPSATDAIRLSTRIGYAWFSQNAVHTNPENGSAPDDRSCAASNAANEVLRSGGYPLDRLTGGRFVKINAGVFRHPCALSRTLCL